VEDGSDRLLSRRRLLETGAAAAASLTLLDSSALASHKKVTDTLTRAQPVRKFARKGYGRSRFAPHVGTTVKLRPPGGAAVRAELFAVEDVANVKGLAGAKDAYTLRFRGPAAAPLAEGIVGVRHKHFGTLQLFISPAGSAGGETRDYTAAINRRIPRNARRRRRPSR